MKCIVDTSRSKNVRRDIASLFALKCTNAAHEPAHLRQFQTLGNVAEHQVRTALGVPWEGLEPTATAAASALNALDALLSLGKWQLDSWPLTSGANDVVARRRFSCAYSNRFRQKPQCLVIARMRGYTEREIIEVSLLTAAIFVC